MRFQLLLKSVACVLLFGSGLEAARPLCSAKNCASISKRDFFVPRQVASAVAVEIEKRALVPVPADEAAVKKYVVAKVNSLHKKDKIYDDTSSKVVSTSEWRAFTSSKGRPHKSFELGLRKLTGCVSLVIVSNKGIYATHFFEDISMDPKNEKDYAPHLLEHGSGKTFQTLKSHLHDLSSSPFGKAFPEVFVVTPVKMNEKPEDPGSAVPDDVRPGAEIGYDAGGALEYPEVTDKIIEAVRALWPNIDTIQTHKYFPLNKNNKEQKDVKHSKDEPDAKKIIDDVNGKILFEYDYADKKAAIRLWIESDRALEHDLTL